MLVNRSIPEAVIIPDLGAVIVIEGDGEEEERRGTTHGVLVRVEDIRPAP